MDYSFLLTGGGSPVKYESAKVRIAKAAFTTPASKPLWTSKSEASATLLSKVLEAKRSKSLVEPVVSVDGRRVDDPDLQTSFTVFRALDRLQALSKTAALKTTSATERDALNVAFQRGLEQVQQYLSKAPGDKVSFAFSKPATSIETTKLPSSAQNVSGSGILAGRYDPIAGVTGNEIIRLNLSKNGASQSVSVDLSTLGGPPTLDGLATAFNDALSTAGYITRVKVEKDGDKWGFGFTTVETERVAFQEDTASDALIISTNRATDGSVTTSRLIKMADLSGAMSYSNLATIAGVDDGASEIAAAQAKAAPKVEGVTPPSTTVYAPTTTQSVITNADGYSFAVGTTSGTMGQSEGDGSNDLFLTKFDSEGKVVWQRMLGAAGEAEGSSVALDAQGNVIVVGSTTGALSTSDAFAGKDAFVTKFNDKGDELFSTQIDGLSASEAKSVAVDAAGNIYMAGTVAGALSGQSANGSDDAFVVKISTTGQVLGKVQFGTAGKDTLGAIAIHPDGSLIVAGSESGQATIRKLDTATLGPIGPVQSLGTGQVSSLAIDATTGSIAIGGATIGGLTAGSQVNGTAGFNDGFVAIFDGALVAQSTTYLGTGSTDQVDSLTFMNGSLYAGGRTNGVLGASKTGAVDGFVTKMDLSGAIISTRQFGGLSETMSKVMVAAAPKGSTILGKLGLQQGEIAQVASDKLTTQTGMRAGDSFTIQVGSLRPAKIVIKADDTIDTLASRIRLATGYKVNMTLTKLSTGNSLKFTAKKDLPISLTAGPEGQDALGKLGIEPTKLEMPKTGDGKAVITPGGSYALNLNDSFTIKTGKDAEYVTGVLEKSIKLIQSAYRSLYWDDTKAALVDGNLGGRGSAYQQSQIKNYQAALQRLTA